MVLVFLICAIFWSFGFILFYCEFGERVSNAFEEIHDTITRFEWYMFPVEMQKLLPIMLIVAEHDVPVEVFGNLTCCREIFKKVREFYLTLAK